MPRYCVVPYHFTDLLFEFLLFSKQCIKQRLIQDHLLFLTALGTSLGPLVCGAKNKAMRLGAAWVICALSFLARFACCLSAFETAIKFQCG